ncbi:MAG: hypothetical protein H6Q67_58 [Firmicutes bacterium]|nr:hypothetical protein [Bacillota bacterium]
MDKNWILDIFKQLRGLDNVVGVGNGYKQIRGENTGKPATVVLVKKKFSKDNLSRGAIIPKQIDGKMTDVIEVGDLRFLAEDRLGKHRPARPGLSMGHYLISAGTFGAVVRDVATGRPLILSNNQRAKGINRQIQGKRKLLIDSRGDF